LENILPFIFLGCRVIVMYERIYNQRFWPNVECWIATKMPTKDGLMPATDDRLRIQVYGIRSAKGKDESSRSFLLSAWHKTTAEEAIESLSEEDILVTNLKDKEVNLKVVASLDQQMRRTYSSKHIEINHAASESAMLKRSWTDQADDKSDTPSPGPWLPTPGPGLQTPMPEPELRDQGNPLREEDESVAV